MVEKLRVLHPEFAQRLRAAAKHRHLGVKNLARIPGISYEMARRYWLGAAKPRGRKMTALADFMGLHPSELEYGGSNRVEQEGPQYQARLPEASLDVARAWSKLSPLLQKLYRDSIFRDAAVETVLPWLKMLKPSSASYDVFEKSVERDYQVQLKQLKLDL